MIDTAMAISNIIFMFSLIPQVRKFHKDRYVQLGWFMLILSVIGLAIMVVSMFLLGKYQTTLTTSITLSIWVVFAIQKFLYARGSKEFLICPVRNQTEEISKIIDPLLSDPNIYYPARDTNQEDEIGLRICKDNRDAIRRSKRIKLIWDGKSQGSLFDLGMAFAFEKPLQIVHVPPATEGKSFQNMAIAYEKESNDA